MLITDIIALVIVVVLVALEMLPEFPQRIIWGVIMFLLGLLPLLFTYNILGLDIYSFNIMRFVAFYVVIVVGGLLFTEGIKEDNLALKFTSMAVGLVIIVVTSIPWLRDFNAISFDMPSYSVIIDFIFYLASGVLTIVGAFSTDR